MEVISIYSLFMIALALALDAFGVSLSIGLNPEVKSKNKIWFCLSFGLFQFILSFIGAYLGFLFNTYILSIPQLVGGVIMTIVGLLMLRDGKKQENKNAIINKKMYFILGVSVSVDAAVIGFTVLNNIMNKLILIEATFFIGIITSILCLFAFLIAGYLRKINIVSKYANYVGGFILMLFGLKMIFF
ncbi:membrane protein [Clostridium novyi B str. ATCC 27606]|uniref:Membrane protein n=1 Tax=Clostridium novyi B str. ATCC 27606 TaxID=1443123 RepID=A0AA40M548_CLONO|nr:membrane protein [Clostridium novyi B str. ATCC 27606]KEI13769.1 membrane protein [Clostridium novyi B str. NCTC 9691]CAG7840286.1 manganese efflux pump MntP [Clostridium haemolyticum]